MTMAGLSLFVCAAVCALSILVAAKAAAAVSAPGPGPGPALAAVWSDEEEDDGLLLASRCNDRYFGFGGEGVAVPV